MYGLLGIACADKEAGTDFIREILGVDEDNTLVTAPYVRRSRPFGAADESSPVFNAVPGRAPLSETVTAHDMGGLYLN